MPEERIVLRNCGIIDPGNINSYREHDGFKALESVLKRSPDDIIEDLKKSGLRGRGGAGFPIGIKWELVRKSPGDMKYIICNADEGEVGTFKDRHILQNDPFSLLEAIIIAGYAIGSTQGYIYLRAEYRFLLDSLKKAIEQVKQAGYLNNFDIDIRLGAGAYVCGEESALMDSIEGKRGEVRFRPPFPPTRGLWQQPTVINNVETLMNVPRILLYGTDWYNSIGTEKSKGTKVFSISGDVKHPGVYELALGSKLSELVQDIAGAEDVLVIQIGGATGRLVPSQMLDTPLSFETFLGAGAVIVYNKSRDIIDIVTQTMEFLAEESCGKCTPCREGTAVLLQILQRFHKGKAKANDIELLEEISSAMSLASMCGLGQAAPTPVIDSLQNFRDVYESRILNIAGGLTC